MNLLMKASDIAHHRLINQQLIKTEITSIDGMIRWLGAMQAQEFAQSKWSIGMRLPDVSEKNIEEAFNRGEIIRTHILRPTWHFVHPADLRWMLQLSGPRVEQSNKYMYRKLELTDTLLAKTTDIIAKELDGGIHLTREQLNTALENKKIQADGMRLSYIMMHAELNGIICSGPKTGNQFTYGLLDERIKTTTKLSINEALSELTKRYFLSHGPATIKDFSTWSGLTISDCTKGIQFLGKQLTQQVINNEKYFFSSETEIHKITNSILLLSIYDEYIMGYKDRSAILEFKNKSAPHSTFTFDNTIVYNGQIIGTWKRKINNKHIELAYAFFSKPGNGQLKSFDEAIEKYQLFHQLPVHLKNV